MCRILAIGPHPDDIEIGCFGSLARYAATGAYEIMMLVITDGSLGSRGEDRLEESEKCANLISADFKTLSHRFEDGRVSFDVDLISAIEYYIREFKPEVVLIPSPNDTHQDHIAVSRASIVATRSVDHIYLYQTPSTTTWEFKPTVYTDITDYIDKKLEAVTLHQSQQDKSYIAERAVKGLAEFRGFDIRRGDRLFEAFELYRSIN